jgi:hypothetical protein
MEQDSMKSVTLSGTEADGSRRRRQAKRGAVAGRRRLRLTDGWPLVHADGVGCAMVGSLQP